MIRAAASTQTFGFFAVEMKIRIIIGRFIIWCFVATLLSGSIVCRSQETSDTLSNVDKTTIVESALQMAFGLTRIGITENLSAENIEFVDPARLSRLGFVLLDGEKMRNVKRSQFVHYVVFDRIVSQNGVVTVGVSQVTESHPCFGRASSSEHNFTYEFRRNSGQWVGHLVHRPLFHPRCATVASTPSTPTPISRAPVRESLKARSCWRTYSTHKLSPGTVPPALTNGLTLRCCKVGWKKARITIVKPTRLSLPRAISSAAAIAATAAAGIVLTNPKAVCPAEAPLDSPSHGRDHGIESPMRCNLFPGFARSSLGHSPHYLSNLFSLAMQAGFLT